MPEGNSSLRNLLHITKRLPTLADAVTSLILEDPIHFLIQLARRAPSTLKSIGQNIHVPQWLPATGQAIWASSLDQSDRAISALDNAPNSRIANALRVQYKIKLPRNSAPDQLARELWEQGDLPGAIAAAPLKSHLGAVLRSQELILQSGSRISLPLAQHGIKLPSEIRALHVLTNSVPWTNSGYALRSHEILRGLQSHGIHVEAVTRLGYPLTIGRPQAANVDDIDGITYRRILPTFVPRLPHQRLAAQAQQLLKIALETKATVLHTTTTYENALVTQAVARALNIPWVYEMRGELEKTWVSRHPKAQQADAETSERFILMRGKETVMAASADAVIVLSDIQRDDLIERGISENKIQVMPNAVDANLLTLDSKPEAARKKLGLQATPETFWVGTISAIVEYEGLDTLIRSVARARKLGAPIQCVIVGDGVALPNLKLLVQELGIEEAVLFPGKVPPAEAVQWYQALDAFVIPRVDTPVTRSVTPVKGLQAMALGIPQIVSDLPALREIGASHGQGLVVPPSDPSALAECIMSLMDDSDLQTELSINARKAATRRTWQAVTKRYEDLYLQLSTEKDEEK